MCGIAGYINPDGPALSESTIRAMLDTLKPRGPEGTSWLAQRSDGSSCWKREQDMPDNSETNVFAMGCSRLAIQDISDQGLQPIPNKDETIWVVLNGEIFNFVELRSELEASGHVFRTGTDTEVIVYAYEEWGVDCFRHFNGKFGIGIYDQNKRQMILGRDRLGVTPLHFCLWDGRLAFASEIKALLQVEGLPREIDHHRLAATVGLPYKLHGVPGQTMFRDIHQVMPGEILIFDENLNMKRELYWHVDQFSPIAVNSFMEAREYLRETLVDAINIRLRTSRRLAFIVSGGVDSPAVVGIASQRLDIEPETFSLDLPDDRFNENDSIREVIQFNGVKSHFIPVTAEVVKKFLPGVMAAADEPLPTPNGVLHGILANAINTEGFKVVLNGVGADEVFCGYHDHFLYFLNHLKKTKNPRYEYELKAWQKTQHRPIEIYEKFCQFIETDEAEYNPDFLARSGGFDYRTCLKKGYGEENIKYSPVFHHSDYSMRAKLVADMMRFNLPAALKMDDGCYMGRAVESRQPFLDYRLVEFGLSLPDHLRIRSGISKFLLRSAVRGYIPASRRRDLRKIGLNLPIDVWMRGTLKEWVEDNLCQKSNPVFNYADFQVTQKIIKSHMSGDANHSMKIWDLIGSNDWLTKFF